MKVRIDIPKIFTIHKVHIIYEFYERLKNQFNFKFLLLIYNKILHLDLV